LAREVLDPVIVEARELGMTRIADLAERVLADCD
jgi:hypothetical protein